MNHMNSDKKMNMAGDNIGMIPLSFEGATENQLTVHYDGKPSYDICLEKDFTYLADKLMALDLKGRKLMVITDSNVSDLYRKEILERLEPIAGALISFVFPAGEASKNLNTVYECYEQLIKAGFDRKDALIALGGGVVGDLTGYVAATYLRGIRFIQIPTTLLSMVDSSIGGKTGVDFQAYKNMVGAFHQPKLVYINLSTLNTLKNREFYSGMGEIIKHGLIKDPHYYSWLKEHREDISNKSYEVLRSMVYRSCQIKKAVVEEDPMELGDRALLNFGHTIGHAVEKLKEFTLLHGECVAVGMAAAAYLSYKRGYLIQTELKDLLDTITAFALPVRIDGLNPQDIYQVTRLDKKMDSNKIRFILLKKLGDSFIDPTVTPEEMLDAIRFICTDTM